MDVNKIISKGEKVVMSCYKNIEKGEYDYIITCKNMYEKKAYYRYDFIDGKFVKRKEKADNPLDLEK